MDTLTGALLSDTPIIQYTVQNEQYVETLKEIYNLDLDDADIAHRKGNHTDLESDLEPGTYLQHLIFFSGDMTFESNETSRVSTSCHPKYSVAEWVRSLSGNI